MNFGKMCIGTRFGTVFCSADSGAPSRVGAGMGGGGAGHNHAQVLALALAGPPCRCPNRSRTQLPCQGTAQRRPKAIPTKAAAKAEGECGRF